METNEAHPDPAELALRLGHAFARPERLAAALTHRSYSAEAGQPELAERASGWSSWATRCWGRSRRSGSWNAGPTGGRVR